LCPISLQDSIRAALIVHCHHQTKSYRKCSFYGQVVSLYSKKTITGTKVPYFLKIGQHTSVKVPKLSDSTAAPTSHNLYISALPLLLVVGN
jgi:hypothetical protein